jgi:drug/metabolite transporter (DMT)-like permease
MRTNTAGPDYWAYLLLLGIGFIWGGQFVFNAQAIEHFPAMTVTATRVVIGALTLTVASWLVSEKAERPEQSSPWSVRLLFIAVALFEGVLPLFLITWGQQHVASSVTAVIVGSVPIATLVLSVFLGSKKSRLSFASAMSVVLGFVGIVVLINPTAAGAGSHELVYELAVFAGVVSFALSMTLFEKLPHGAPIRTARNILWIASIPLVVVALAFDKPWLLSWGFSEVLPVLVLGVVGSGVAYVMYASLIQRSGPVFTSISNFIVPVVGVLLGVAVRGEYFGTREVLALLFIIAALAANEIKFSKKAKSSMRAVDPF